MSFSKINPVVNFLKKHCKLANRLSDETKESSSDIPWLAIRGMRNLHAHDYENVDMEIVWNTLLEDIPTLKQNMEALLYQKQISYTVFM
ncbi:MAG: DUF86 domain-containing protein [Lachnospiraceae bacterium]|nr:DUF86 domain-containing protein [Lachnospiraceae bacterium]